MQAMMNDAGSSNIRIQPNFQSEFNGAVQQVNNTSASQFGDLLKQALDNVNGLQSETGRLRNAVEMGDRSVSLAEAMIASQKSSIAFEATVQVRNKLVDAYKQIMSMPV
jgi:flagellar hook-basal body complex protein FliE